MRLGHAPAPSLAPAQQLSEHRRVVEERVAEVVRDPSRLAASEAEPDAAEPTRERHGQQDGAAQSVLRHHPREPLAVVARGFQTHITSHKYGADQIRFLRSVQEVFLAKRRLSEADLYEAPLTNFGRNAVERFFTQSQIKEIVALADHLAA